MLSAIAPRKDSAQSSKERLKQRSCDYAPHTTSPLANSWTADIVTNDDRAKPADIVRVLSPMRPRRTPKLVNAPVVQWRLSPHLQHMPSLDSLLSSNTSVSESSTVHSVPVTPHNVALPVSSASSVITALPDTVSQEVPLPPSPSSPHPSSQGKSRSGSPPQKVDVRFSEAHLSESPRLVPQLGPHQPHSLSPVIEATSAPSLHSSILDLTVQDIGTAERRPLSDVGQQDVHIVGAGDNGAAARQSRPRRKGASERVSRDREERYGPGPASAEQGGDVLSGDDDGEKQRVRRMVGKLGKRAKRAARRAAQYLARKYVTRALARLL